jgi:hypothetical protein
VSVWPVTRGRTTQSRGKLPVPLVLLVRTVVCLENYPAHNVVVVITVLLAVVYVLAAKLVRTPRRGQNRAHNVMLVTTPVPSLMRVFDVVLVNTQTSRVACHVICVLLAKVRLLMLVTPVLCARLVGMRRPRVRMSVMIVLSGVIVRQEKLLAQIAP